MKNNPANFYNERLVELEATLKVQKAKSTRIVSLRLVLALVMIVLAYVFIQAEQTLVFIVAEVVLLGIFIYLVQEHLKLKKQVRSSQKLIEINKNELKALNGDFGFTDNGRKYLDYSHRNAFDLDLYGDKSLFQRLNRTTTQEGGDSLAKEINKQESIDLDEKQSILKELSKKVSWRQEYQSVGLLEAQNSGYEELKSWFSEQTIFANNKILKLLSLVSPIMFFVLVLIVLLGVLPNQVLVGYFMLQLLITGSQFKKVNQLHGQLSKKQEALNAYEGLLKSLITTSFTNATLEEIRKRAEGGHTAIAMFKRLLGLLDSRLNMIMGIVLNGVFLWDIRLTIKIEEWREKHKMDLVNWIGAIAEMEACNSMANYVFNHSSFTWPKKTDNFIINSSNLGHPFLNEDARISNEFKLLPNGQVVLLSGANMSGKSTFLRTVGLNLAMANMGLPVCADAFEFNALPIYTSMRINDSLQESESYFFAELKRLKFIIDTIKEGNDIFILMDEILRGTNSNDKHQGSAGLIKQLINLKTSGIVASHDITLASLATEFPKKLINRSFEVENENGELVFDYKLREGVCQNLNASYLMEKMGIV